MTQSRPRIRVFISSPGDVRDERAVAHDILRRLGAEYHGRIDFEPYLWEQQPFGAQTGFQEQIVSTADCDAVACVIWNRLGTRLPPDRFKKPDGSPYESGTEFEFLQALWAGEQRTDGRPRVIVYRKTAPCQIAVDDPSFIQVHEQRTKVKNFFDAHFSNPDGTVRRASHSFETVTQFGHRFEEHMRALAAEWFPEQVAAAATASKQWEGSPYRGLAAFEYEHAKIFFGRQHAVSEIVDALRQQASSGTAFVVILGMSGSGKSSVARAGVAPTLCESRVIEGVTHWRRASFRPADGGEDLIAGLAGALVQEHALPELAGDGLADRLRDAVAGKTGSLSRIRELLTQAALGPAAPDDEPFGENGECRGRLLLLVDQLEELFTLPRLDDRLRSEFIDCLSFLSESGLVWVLATLRSDFYAACQSLPGLVRLKAGKGQYDLLRPTPEEIGQMIRLPTRMAALRFEEDSSGKARLEDELRDAAASSPEALPLLEFALEELYKRRMPDGLLTFAAYRELGGLEGALARRAEEVFRSLPEPVQAAMPAVLRRLVSLGSDSDRATGLRPERCAVCVDAPATAFVDAFVEARLFVSAASESGEPVVGFSHEALLRHWPRLQEWLEDDRAFLIWRSRLADVLADWARTGRDPGTLLRGAQLAEARQWLIERPADISPPAREFIDASAADAEREEAEKEARRQRELEVARAEAATAARLRRRAWLLGAVCVIAVGLGVSSQINARRAEQARVVADRSAQLAKEQEERAERQAAIAEAGRLAAEATDQLRHRKNAPLALVLATEALFGGDPDIPRHPSAEQTLRDALAACGGRLVPGAAGRAQCAAVHPDGSLVAFGTATGQVVVSSLDADVNRALCRAPAPGDSWQASQEAIVDIDIAPGGEYLATMDGASTAVIWRLPSGSKHAVVATFQTELRTSSGSVSPSVFFGADGRTLFRHTSDGSLYRSDPSGSSTTLWDSELDGDFILQIASSQKRSIIAAALQAGPARIWPAASAPARGLELPGCAPATLCFGFAADAPVMATGGVSDVVQIWRTDPVPRLLGEARSGTEMVFSLAFDPAGTKMAIGTVDAEFVDLSAGPPYESFVLPEGDSAKAKKVVFSLDGKWLAAGCVDHSAKIWPLHPRRAPSRAISLTGHSESIEAVIFTDDSRRVIAGDAVGSLRVWDLGDHDFGISAPIVGTGDGKAMEAAFVSPGNVFIAGADGRARLWEFRASMNPSAAVLELPGYSPAYAASLAPDRSMFAAAVASGSIGIWNLATPGARPRWLEGHSGPVAALAFSANGKLLASSGSDMTLRAWDLSSGGGTSITLDSGLEPSFHIALSPDGCWLATRGETDSVRLWKLGVGHPARPEPICRASLLSREQFGAGGHTFVYQGEDLSIRLLRLDASSPSMPATTIATMEEAVYRLKLSPDGVWIGALADSGIVYLWKTAAPGRAPIKLGDGSPRMVDLEFSPDGRWLATDYDRLVRLFDLKSASIETAMITLPGSHKLLTHMLFDPDGRLFASVDTDGSIRTHLLRREDLREYAMKRATRNLTPEEWGRFVGSRPYAATFPHLPSR